MLLAVVAGPPTYTPPEIIASRLPTADRLLPNKAGVLRGASIWLVCTAAAAVAGVIEERAAIAANWSHCEAFWLRILCWLWEVTAAAAAAATAAIEADVFWLERCSCCC